MQPKNDTDHLLSTPANAERLAKSLEEAKAPKKQPTPTEQWDILAAKVIGQELAPKGFKKLTSGSFKGLEIANHSTPGITKATVKKCQSIGASLVRGFREKLRKEIEAEIKKNDEICEGAKSRLANLPFWRFEEIREEKRLIRHYESRVGGMLVAKGELDITTIQ